MNNRLDLILTIIIIVLVVLDYLLMIPYKLSRPEKFCPECGFTTQREDFSYCGVCGTELKEKG